MCVYMYVCVVLLVVVFRLRRSECETEIIMKEEEDRERIKEISF